MLPMIGHRISIGGREWFKKLTKSSRITDSSCMPSFRLFCTHPNPNSIIYSSTSSASPSASGTAAHWVPKELIGQLNPYMSVQQQQEIPRTPEQLYVREFGDGSEAVLMLHGLLQNGSMWWPLIPYVNTQKFRFICPDLLGHGESSSAPYLKYTPTTHLHYIQRDVTDRMGIITSSWSMESSKSSGFHLVGEGLGAILALELAAVMPSRIKSLHLISLPYYESEQEAAEDLLSHLVQPMGQFKALSRISSAILSKSNDLLVPLVELTNYYNSLQTGGSYNMAAPSLAGQVHAYCSSLDESLVKHRPDVAASIVSQENIPVHLVSGSNDTELHHSNMIKFQVKQACLNSTLSHVHNANALVTSSNPASVGSLLMKHIDTL